MLILLAKKKRTAKVMLSFNHGYEFSFNARDFFFQCQMFIKNLGRRRPNTLMFVFISPPFLRYSISKNLNPYPNFEEIMSRLCYPRKTRFPVKTNISKVFSPK